MRKCSVVCFTSFVLVVFLLASDGFWLWPFYRLLPPSSRRPLHHPGSSVRNAVSSSQEILHTRWQQYFRDRDRRALQMMMEKRTRKDELTKRSRRLHSPNAPSVFRPFACRVLVAAVISCLIEHVESPQPFILGVHTDWLSDIAPDALEEVTIVFALLCVCSAAPVSMLAWAVASCCWSCLLEDAGVFFFPCGAEYQAHAATIHMARFTHPKFENLGCFFAHMGKLFRVFGSKAEELRVVALSRTRVVAPLGRRLTHLSAARRFIPPQLIIVDCDLGTVGGWEMEQLPPPVRRSLTKAVRAVLHGNLGNLDAPVRLSKPEAAAASTAAAEAASAGGRSGVGAPPSSLSRQGGTSASGNGFDRTVAAVGMSAWADRDPRATAGPGGRQGGGEKSAEAGDSSSRSRQHSRSAGADGSGGGGGEEVTERKARRGRTRGAAARMEALLRLEFARAMADMLYGFTECLFFLHPDRPIFNGARFLQVEVWLRALRFLLVLCFELFVSCCWRRCWCWCWWRDGRGGGGVSVVHVSRCRIRNPDFCVCAIRFVQKLVRTSGSYIFSRFQALMDRADSFPPGPC